MKQKHFLLGRTIGNVLAVYCFFKSVDLISVAHANILNMTYPLFITIFSWIFFKIERDVVTVGIVFMALTGVWLILSPGSIKYDINSLWGIASGLTAAISIIYLDLARKSHDTDTILFFMFGIGGLLIFCLFFHQLAIPKQKEIPYLLGCSLAAIGGQYLLTAGFRYVTVIEGGG